jgi:hypothetical protein
MLLRQNELPPAVAKAFVRDMKAYFQADNQNQRDEIAPRQRSALSQHQGPRDRPLPLTEVIKMFYGL